jgi:hypothetical protein
LGLIDEDLDSVYAAPVGDGVAFSRTVAEEA